MSRLLESGLDRIRIKVQTRSGRWMGSRSDRTLLRFGQLGDQIIVLESPREPCARPRRSIPCGCITKFCLDEVSCGCITEFCSDKVHTHNFWGYSGKYTEVSLKWDKCHLIAFFILNPTDQVSLRSEFVWDTNLGLLI